MPRSNSRDSRLSDLLRTKSASMRDIVQTIEKIAGHDVSLLILGESGSGKDYVAEAIHACGPRAAQPFVRIDCPAIPADLFESELFGHEKGAFTDAQTRKLGKLEMARGGTVYFDEIAALAPSVQAKLLRAIQDRVFSRLGGSQPIELAARIISSSNVDLEDSLASGEFRRDLFYRINVVTLNLPSLRERLDDIPRLARGFLRAAAKSTRRKIASIAPDAMALLCEHAWPGNLRELRNVIERAVVLESSDMITIESLPPNFPTPQVLVDNAVRDQWTLEQLESRYIREILRQTGENYSRASTLLGINRKTLLEKRKRYGL